MKNKETQAVERRYQATTMKVETRMDGDTPIELGVVEGYAALYDVETVIGGWFREVIRPGFFDNVLNDDVRCLKNHDPHYRLARSKNGQGTLSLSLDEKGLKYSYTTPDISYAKDLQRSMELGDVTQSSFSFIPDEVNWVEKEGEMELRELVKCKTLYDVSPVTFPAYNDTSVAKRSWEAYKAEKEAREIQVNNPEEIKVMDEFEARHKFNVNKYNVR